MASVTVGELRLHVDEAGSGEALVLLSGLGGDHRAFSVTSRALSAHYRVLAIDARDAGLSDRASGSYRVADLAADVAGCLDALGVQQASVLGHSLGGLVAQELALRYPERVGRLILVSSHSSSNDWRRAVVGSWILMKRNLTAGEFARATLPWLAGRRFFQNTAQIEGLVRFAEKNPWPQPPDAFERQAEAALGHDARVRLGSIVSPTLVISGVDDLVNPPDVAAELASAIPGARFVPMEGVGHLPHIEDGAEFRSIVAAFLGEGSH